MKKVFTVSIILVLALAMAVGCTPKPTNTPPESSSITSSVSSESEATWEDKEITIRFLNRYAEGVEQMYGPLSQACKDFEDLHSNVTVVYDAVAGQDDTQYYEKMRTAAATGDMYELIANYGGSTVVSYAETGVFLDLSDEFAADPEWRNSFSDVFSMWEYAGIEGTFGVPFTYFATVLYCNKLFFEENDLEIPTTISEIEAVCDAFVAKGIVPFPRSGEGWRWAHLATGMVMQKYGSDLIYDLASRKTKYTGEEMMSIAQLFADWQTKGYFGKNIASLDSATESMLFSTGQSPMTSTGPWQVQHIVGNGSQEVIDNIEVVWFPAFDDKPDLAKSTMGGAEVGLSVAAKDEDTTAATVALLKYLTSGETMTKLWSASPTSLFAVKTATPPEAMDKLTKDIIALINSLDPSMMQEIDMYDSIPGMQDTLRNAYAGMMAGGTPAEAMKKVQDEIDNYVP